MLKKTFVHISGIGPKREQQLWRSGVTSWTDLHEGAGDHFNIKTARTIMAELKRTREAYEKNDLHYFSSRLPRRDVWRVVPGNENSIAFVDIETTGLGLPPQCKVTTISALFRGKLHQAHDDKGKRRLVEMLEGEASIFVTYFGDVFDLPFLRRAYRVPLKKAQVDLCFLLRRHGHTGGLKAVERQFRSIPRRKSVGIDGFDAVRLWRMYEGGNHAALRTLLAYNGEDTLVLHHLLERFFVLESKARRELEVPILRLPKLPKFSQKPDKRVLKQLWSDDSMEDWY